MGCNSTLTEYNCRYFLVYIYKKLNINKSYTKLECNFFHSAIYLEFTQTFFNFNESDGTIKDVVVVQKTADSPLTEVDIPFQVMTINGTANASTGPTDITSYV